MKFVDDDDDDDDSAINYRYCIFSTKYFLKDQDAIHILFNVHIFNIVT